MGLAADHDAAVEALPRKLAELKRREAAVADAQAALERCRSDVQDLLGRVIVGLEERGQMAITTMASGAVVYWLPDEELG